MRRTSKHAVFIMRTDAVAAFCTDKPSNSASALTQTAISAFERETEDPSVLSGIGRRVRKFHENGFEVGLQLRMNEFVLKVSQF
jgi:hypothetical protein